MNRLLILPFFVAHLVILVAQEPKFIQHEIGNLYKNIHINVMLQDSQGMIWLGTKNGLARYDGNTLEPITLDSY